MKIESRVGEGTYSWRTSTPPPLLQIRQWDFSGLLILSAIKRSKAIFAFAFSQYKYTLEVM